MSASIPNNDASRWTAIAAVVVHYLDACLSSGGPSETTSGAVPEPLPKGMFRAAENLLVQFRGNIPAPEGASSPPVRRSSVGLANYIVGLESLPEPSARTSTTAAEAVDSYLECLRRLNSGERVPEVSREAVEATRAFFFELKRRGDRARANEFARSESPILSRARS